MSYDKKIGDLFFNAVSVSGFNRVWRVQVSIIDYLFVKVCII